MYLVKHLREFPLNVIIFVFLKMYLGQEHWAYWRAYSILVSVRPNICTEMERPSTSIDHHVIYAQVLILLDSQFYLFSCLLEGVLGLPRNLSKKNLCPSQTHNCFSLNIQRMLVI